MTLLFENPIPIYFLGAVFLLITGLTFLSRRNLQSLVWFGVVLLATLVMLGVERLVVTDREEVEVALAALMNSLEQNDMEGVLAFIDPDALEVRADVTSMMPEAKLEETGATMVHIELTENGAFSQFLGRVDGVHRTGHRLFYLDEVRIDWRKRDGRWLVADYQAMWRGKPIDAVDSMRANKPRP